MKGLQFQVIGHNAYDFTNDKGEHIAGTKFYVARPFKRTNPSTRGLEATSFTVPQDVLDRCGYPELNAVYDAVYDERGRIFHYKKAT